MLRTLKRLLLEIARSAGFNALLLGSRWRQRRLLILGYHGLSLDDEHRWNPGLYMSVGFFRERLEKLRALECGVLPLGEAVERLFEGQLPPRSVALTFDDGFYDFYQQASPLLREFGMPATVYVSTYYCEYNRPVFDPMVRYLLWKAKGRRLEWPGVLAAPAHLEEVALPGIARRIYSYAWENRLTARDKDALLGELASRMKLRYDELCTRRILHLMNGSELRAVAEMGFDVQLHTHRHRVPREKERFLKEIQDNRTSLAPVTKGERGHFCYPSGVYLPVFADWLRECGVRSATTCEPGLAAPSSNPWLLPRVVDTSTLPDLVFESWLSGTPAFLPRRRTERGEEQVREQ